MDSTEQDRQRQQAADFFERHLLPAFERLCARGIDPLAQPSADAESWYSVPVGATDLDELPEGDYARWLTDHWRREGLEELIPIIEPLLELARKLEPKAEMTGEVSPFIYQMF